MHVKVQDAGLCEEVRQSAVVLTNKGPRLLLPTSAADGAAAMPPVYIPPSLGNTTTDLGATFRMYPWTFVSDAYARAPAEPWTCAPKATAAVATSGKQPGRSATAAAAQANLVQPCQHGDVLPQCRTAPSLPLPHSRQVAVLPPQPRPPPGPAPGLAPGAWAALLQQLGAHQALAVCATPRMLSARELRRRLGVACGAPAAAPSTPGGTNLDQPRGLEPTHCGGSGSGVSVSWLSGVPEDARFRVLDVDCPDFLPLVSAIKAAPLPHSHKVAQLNALAQLLEQQWHAAGYAGAMCVQALARVDAPGALSEEGTVSTQSVQQGETRHGACAEGLAVQHTTGQGDSQLSAQQVPSAFALELRGSPWLVTACDNFAKPCEVFCTAAFRQLLGAKVRVGCDLGHNPRPEKTVLSSHVLSISTLSCP